MYDEKSCLPPLCRKNSGTSSPSMYQFLCSYTCTYPSKILKTVGILLAHLRVAPNKTGMYVLSHKARSKTRRPDQRRLDPVPSSSVDWFYQDF